MMVVMAVEVVMVVILMVVLVVVMLVMVVMLFVLEHGSGESLENWSTPSDSRSYNMKTRYTHEDASRKDLL